VKCGDGIGLIGQSRVRVGFGSIRSRYSFDQFGLVSVKRGFVE